MYQTLIILCAQNRDNKMPLIVLIGICFAPEIIVLHIGFILHLLINSAIQSLDIFRGLATCQAWCGHLGSRGKTQLCLQVLQVMCGQIGETHWDDPLGGPEGTGEVLRGPWEVITPESHLI